MDVNNTDARREVELANRLLRDREVDHTRELDNLRKSQHEQIDELTANQQQSLKRVRDQANDAMTNTRDHFDKSMRENTDTYERQMNDQRTEAYDRFGRLASDSSRERSQAQELKNRQLNDIMNGQADHLKALQEAHAQSTEKMEKAFRKDTNALETGYEKKLSGKDEAMKEILHKEQEGFRDAAKESQARTAKMAHNDKQGADARYRKLLEDSGNEQNRLVRSATQREMQLRNDSAFNQQNLKQAAERSFDDYRERAADALASTIEKDNKQAAQTARTTESRFSQSHQEAENEKQRMRNEFRSLESELQSNNEIEAKRNALHTELSEKRHRQEINLTQNAINENNDLNSGEMKARYQERLHDIEENHRRDFAKHQAASQNKMFTDEMMRNTERGDSERQRTHEMSKLAAEHSRDRNDLVRDYESRQRMTEEVAARQRSETERDTREQMKDLRDQTSKDISTANRDKQFGVYTAQQELRNRTDELEAQRKMELGDAEGRYNSRMKRTNEAYNRNLLSNKDAFDEESQVAKYESQMQMLKARGDAEHEKRMALLDMLQKNRAQMSTMEARINEMKDEHDGELAKAKAENDKAMRDVTRHARETLETERTLHARELEARDMAVKEKLKLQEEAFRDDIEKLKRSHEVLKKS